LRPFGRHTFMTKRTASVLVLCALPLLAAELPVRQVVLYKHGVGYFERSGTLGPGETARLDFNAAEMNDVLKSLTIEEKGGGKINGLRYDSSIPLEQKLAEFPIRIEDGRPLTALIDQLKGARVEISLGAEKVAGTIVGARIIPGEKDKLEREQVSLLLDSGDLRTIELASTSSIHFPDPKVQLQFRDYLAAVAGARSKDKRSLYIDSTDAKAREVLASYIIPSPVWKSSYRLIFDSGVQPTLEGWAIVDNTTGEDWTNVKMSLISGKPISFISALYEPKYIQRLSAELAEDRPVAPTVYSGGVMGAISGGFPAAAPPAAPQMMRKGGNVAGGSGGGVAGGFLDSSQRVEVEARRSNIPSSIGASAEGRDLGDLFAYSIAAPVTVKKNESAMLPFLQQKITGRRLLIYSDASMQNPFNAAELTNSSGKTLDGGPITVFDSGAYAGEALVETVKAGDKRLINYAVDLGTRITTNLDSKAEIVREIHAVRGMITARYSAQETKTYTIRNVDAKAKTLIIEHPVRPQYNLLSAKPAETTARAYRFEVKLAPDSTQKFPVEEERVYSNQFMISSMTPDRILVFIENKSLSDAGRRALQQVADAKKQIGAFDAQSKDIDGHISNLVRDQDRMRQNITSLNQVSGQQQLVQGYAAKLAEQESQIAKLRDQQSDVQQKRNAAQAGLDNLLEKIEF
jgi:hypothetical protein